MASQSLIKYIDTLTPTIKRLQVLEAKALKDWDDQKIETFRKWLMKQYSEDTGNEWAQSSTTLEGFLVSPGYKLDMVERILKGEVEIPAPKIAEVFG